jgi:hypothetical protein
MPSIVGYVLLSYIGMLKNHPNTPLAPTHDLSPLNWRRGGRGEFLL